MEVTDINLADPGAFVDAVPHEWFAFLRREAPVQWHPDPDGFAEGFWSVTRYDDCVGVNRDYEHFSSYRAATLFHDFDEEVLGQQRMMMLNMDPPMHTRYRRLVNKGFTPRMIRDLEVKVVAATDAILDTVCEQGSADFVEQVSAELPLQVIADLMGVPQEDRHLVFDWSNRMVGSDDPEYQLDADAGAQASMELFAYADELCEKKRLDPHEDLFSVLTQAEIEGDQLSQLELDLFFMLLAVAGNETTRNLISGAMVAFFDHPDQWERLRADRSLLPSAIEEMLRFVSPVMHFRRQASAEVDHRRPEDRRGRQGGVLAHLGQPGRVGVRRPQHLRHRPHPQQPYGLRRGRPPLLPGGQSGPHGDPGDVRPPARPDARHPAGRRGPEAAIQLHQRREAHPGGLHPLRPGRPLNRGSRPPSPRQRTLEAQNLRSRPETDAQRMRFHQAVTFLPLDEVVSLSTAADTLGYSGIYLSDHLFNPRDLQSKYTYSKAPDGSPFWEKETAWPDPMCLISALSGVTTNLTFTTGIYIAPVRDLITVAKTVGTAAVLSGNRVRLGVGVGWCEEEYVQTGQDFRTRGRAAQRDDPGPQGPVAGRLGGVPR